jgi:hypothetical protein
MLETKNVAAGEVEIALQRVVLVGQDRDGGLQGIASAGEIVDKLVADTKPQGGTTGSRRTREKSPQDEHCHYETEFVS